MENEIYICDPEKASVECTMEACFSMGGPCKCTSKPEYAKIGADGKPVIADLEDYTNRYY